MKVLFYLPAVTPWWFETIVEPLIRRVADVAEVHVLAPEPWCNTGIGPQQLARCVDLPQVNWAIVDGPDHPSLRTSPADAAGLIAYVAELAPDYVFCRTADFETVRHFPGIVRFLMEVAASPFHLAGCTIVEEPFVNGALPLLSPAECDRLLGLIAPLWSEMHRFHSEVTPSRADLFAAVGIPLDRPVLLLPLEYEHSENFFLQHRVGPAGNAALVAAIAERVTPACTLVVTNHPLNVLHVDNRQLVATVERLGRRVILADSRVGLLPASLALVPRVDGILLGDSKSFALGAAFGVPMFRQSRFRSADWLRTETDLDRFVAAVRAGRARAPSSADARLWFAYHFANETFGPKDPALGGEEILDRAARPVNPARWDPAIARARAVKEGLLQ